MGDDTALRPKLRLVAEPTQDPADRKRKQRKFNEFRPGRGAASLCDECGAGLFGGLCPFCGGSGRFLE